MSIFETFRSAIEQLMAYLRTCNALRSLQLNTSLDLDIYPGDADRIARKAVYG